MGELHICTGTNKRYLAQVRRPGDRKWTTLGKPRKSFANARRAVFRAMGDGKWYSHGEVAMTADYYDPHTIWQAKFT